MPMEKTIYSEGYRLLVEWLKAERDRRLDVAEYVRYCHTLKVNPRKGIAILEGEIGGSGGGENCLRCCTIVLRFGLRIGSRG